MVKKILCILVCGMILTASVFSLSACNTFEGLGRDVKSAGEAMSDAAQGGH